MIKRCPIMSKQNESLSKIYCFEKECAFWDEEREQCCIKSLVIAIAGKKDGGASDISLQAEYVYPISTTPVVSPNSSGNPINPNPYTITCNLGEITQ